MFKFLTSEEFLKYNTVLSSDEIEAVEAYIYSDCDFGDFEVLYAYFKGCLVIRYYSEDAGYHFEAPIALSEHADISSAYLEITEYCKMQRIPEIVIGIAKDDRELFLRGAEHYREAEDEDGSFGIEIITECMNTLDLPEMLWGEVYLGEFVDKFAEDYEKLIRNVNNNRHFGYNLTDDLPNGTGVDFINFVREEFENGEAMTFAATILSEGGANVFVGEGTLYGFDGRGNASISFRVLPEYQKRGYGKSIFLALVSICDEIGVHTLTSDVMMENIPSLTLLCRYASSKKENGADKFHLIFNVKQILDLQRGS